MDEETSKLSTAHVSEFEPVAPDVLNAIPLGLIRLQKIVPLKKNGKQLTVGTSKIEGVIKPEGLNLVTGFFVEYVLLPVDEISDFIHRHYDAEPVQRYVEVPAELIVPKSEPNPPAAVVIHDSTENQQHENTLNLEVGVKPSSYTNSDFDFDAETAALLGLDLNVEPGVEYKPEKSPIPMKDSEILEDFPLPSEFEFLMKTAVTHRASEVVVNSRGQVGSTRLRLRGTLVLINADNGGLTSAQIQSLMMWISLNGERFKNETLEWADFRREIKVGSEFVVIHACLTTSPTANVLTIRLNAHKDNLYAPSSWGMDSFQAKLFTELLQSKQGLILFVGSESDGISHNLNSTARHLAAPSRHVVAVEPYLESWMPEVNQFVSKGDPFLFSQLLQVAFRHTPDVVIVNPLEQKEHIEFCLQKARQGCLVLGRSNAVDATNALEQMVGQGIDPYLLASSILGVVAKRTIRLNCPHCQAPDPGGVSQAKELGLPDGLEPTKFYASKGCDSCQKTGYGSEADIFEVLNMTPSLKSVFTKDFQSEKLREQIQASRFLSLRKIALHKAINGQTSVSEVVRVTPK